MNRREALAKATITTATSADGLLDAEQGTAFIRTLKEKTALSTADPPGDPHRVHR